MKKEEYDPITLEIIQSSLQATADEMFASIRKTAMSSIIYEVLDMGTGIMDAEGEIASSGAGIPAFIGVLDKAVKVILDKFDQPGDIQEGDVFMTNDPYYGGVTHLNDIVFAIGPAGTGKTYQAVALAVSALKNKEVQRIVITRPVVEAGEHLGFLPGDIKEEDPKPPLDGEPEVSTDPVLVVTL